MAFGIVLPYCMALLIGKVWFKTICKCRKAMAFNGLGYVKIWIINEIGIFNYLWTMTIVNIVKIPAKVRIFIRISIRYKI